MIRELDEREANALAEKVLAVDHSIMSVGIIDELGTPLGGAIRKSLQGKLPSNKEEWERRAYRAAAIMGITMTDDAQLSPIQSVMLIRKENKSLLIQIPETTIIIAAVFESFKRGSELSKEIIEMLARK